MTQTVEVAVIGGGMVGAAIGLGLACKRAEVIILDEGDNALRTARGNFGLVWTQTKGLGLQRYQEWSRESAAIYSTLPAFLLKKQGLEIGHEQSGGLSLCTSREEFNASQNVIDQMKAQVGNLPYEAEMIDRKTIEELIPGCKIWG